MITEADMLSFQDKNDWKAIPRLSRTVPFGYKVDPDNPDLLQPIILELEALEKAKVHLRQFGYRAVAAWLTQITGRSISHMGLKKRIDNERKRRNQAKTFELWANRLEEARAKAEAYTQARTGARDPKDNTDQGDGEPSTDG